MMNAATKHQKREDIPAWKIALFGGIAGEVLWLASYPMDVIKSKMQTDALDKSQQRYKGTIDCIRKTWVTEGALGFWRGIAPTLMRAMPVSAGTFFT